MDQPASRRRAPRVPRLPVWALAALFPFALIPFATVHALPRLAMGLAAGVLGLWACAYGLRQRRPSTPVALLALGGGAALFVSALPLIPVGPATRVALQPGLGHVVQQSLSMAGVERAPLALDPNGALQGWSTSAQALLLAVGAALANRSSRRAAQLASVLLGAGVSLVVIALAHRVTGAESIWWISEVPSFSRAPFFGPSVNPNHGGVACAALLPLAAALGLSRRTTNRVVGGVAAALLLLGLRASGSRGALLSAAVGGFVLVALMGGRRVRLALLGFLSVGALGVLGVGPDRVAEAMSAWLVPEALGPGEDLYTGRPEIWREVLGLVAAAPLLGVGHAGFNDGIQLFKVSPTFTRLDHAHQELLQIAAEHGLLVLGLWTLIVGLIFVHGAVRAIEPSLSSSRRRTLAGFLAAGAALLSACLYTFPLRIGALELLGALLLGSVAGLSGRGEGGRAVRRYVIGGVCIALFGMSLVGQGLAFGLADHPSSGLGSADAAMARGDARLEASKNQPGAAAEASAWYRLALHRQPLRREPLQLLHRSIRAEPDGSSTEALRALMVATQVYPTLPWPHADLARFYRSWGEPEASRAAWRRALWCDLPEGVEESFVEEALRGPGDPARIVEEALPQRGDRRAYAGRLMERSGHQEVAESCFREAAELDDTYGAHLGAALLRWDRPAESLAAAQRVTPTSCFSSRVEGRALLAIGELTRAQEAVRAADVLCGEANSRELRLLSADIWSAQGDERAIAIYETLLEQTPGDHAARRALIAELRSRGWEEQLATQLRALLEQGAARPAEQLELRRLSARGITGR